MDVYVCMCRCVYVRVYVCIYMYVCMYVCIYVCMYVCICMFVCMYVCVYVCVYICLYVYVCVCTYVYVVVVHRFQTTGVVLSININYGLELSYNKTVKMSIIAMNINGLPYFRCLADTSCTKVGTPQNPQCHFCGE
jgi:hypothetical protein